MAGSALVRFVLGCDSVLDLQDRLHGTRVLIVDDDFEMRRWLQVVFERRGACVEQAASGWELLSLLADQSFDLVITDVRMPMPNGISALSMVRAAGVTTPFVVITAFADVSLSALVERSMAAALLGKPFEEDELLDLARASMQPQHLTAINGSRPTECE